MSLLLNPDIRDLLARDDTVKFLVTVDAHAAPHLVVEKYLSAGDDGYFHYLVIDETSLTHQNLVRNIWFDREVIVALVGTGGQTLAVKGKPVKNLITGPIFTDHYVRLRETTGEDLAGVWLIEPGEIVAEPERKVPAAPPGPYSVLHLDRIARTTA